MLGKSDDRGPRGPPQASDLVQSEMEDERVGQRARRLRGGGREADIAAAFSLPGGILVAWLGQATYSRTEPSLSSAKGTEKGPCSSSERGEIGLLAPRVPCPGNRPFIHFMPGKEGHGEP